MTTPAGWYPDPQDPGRLRYWSGNAWTDHIHPAQPGAVPPPWPTQAPGGARGAGMDLGPNSALHYIAPVGRSWQSVVAPWAGILSLMPAPIWGHLLGIAACLLGVWALSLAPKGGHGSGRATIGLVLGGIGFVSATVTWYTMFD